MDRGELQWTIRLRNDGTTIHAQPRTCWVLRREWSMTWVRLARTSAQWDNFTDQKFLPEKCAFPQLFTTCACPFATGPTDHGKSEIDLPNSELLIPSSKCPAGPSCCSRMFARRCGLWRKAMCAWPVTRTFLARVKEHPLKRSCDHSFSIGNKLNPVMTRDCFWTVPWSG